MVLRNPIFYHLPNLFNMFDIDPSHGIKNFNLARYLSICDLCISISVPVSGWLCNIILTRTLTCKRKLERSFSKSPLLMRPSCLTWKWQGPRTNPADDRASNHQKVVAAFSLAVGPWDRHELGKSWPVVVFCRSWPQGRMVYKCCAEYIIVYQPSLSIVRQVTNTVITTKLMLATIASQ